MFRGITHIHHGQHRNVVFESIRYRVTSQMTSRIIFEPIVPGGHVSCGWLSVRSYGGHIHV